MVSDNLIEGVCSMFSEDTMRVAKIVRIIDHGTNVQLLCADDLGLLSVYLKNQAYSRFCRMIRKAGLNLKGLEIRFNRNTVLVPALGQT